MRTSVLEYIQYTKYFHIRLSYRFFVYQLRSTWLTSQTIRFAFGESRTMLLRMIFQRKFIKSRCKMNVKRADSLVQRRKKVFFPKVMSSSLIKSFSVAQPVTMTGLKKNYFAEGFFFTFFCARKTSSLYKCNWLGGWATTFQSSLLVQYRQVRKEEEEMFESKQKQDQWATTYE